MREYNQTPRLDFQLIFICVLLSGLGCIPKTSQEFCKAGQKKMYKEKTQTLAFNYFKKAIQLDSNYHKAYFLIGETYRIIWHSSWNESDLKECRYYYLKAISKDSANPGYWFILGDTYSEEGVKKRPNLTIDPVKLNEAIHYFTKSINFDSTYESSYYGRAYCYNYFGDSISQNKDLMKSCELGNKMSCWMLKTIEK